MKHWTLQALCLSLAACSSTPGGLLSVSNSSPQDEKNPIESSASTLEKRRPRLIEPGEYVERSKERLKEGASIGPQLSEAAASGLRDNARVRIAQDVPASYLGQETPRDVFNVSLSFNEVSMLAVAQMFSEISGVNILVGDEVQKNLVTAKLINVPWDKGLNAILKTKRLAKHVDSSSNIIRIHDQATLVALEDFDRKRAEDLQRSLELKQAVASQYTEIFRLYYSDPEAIKAEILSVLKGSDEPEKGGQQRTAKVTVDKRVNALIVKGTRQELDLVHRLLEKVDVRTQQVLIEAFIVEASDAFGKELGARLGLDGVSSNSAGTTSLQLAGTASTPSSTPGTLSLSSAAGAVSNLALDNPYGGVGWLFKSSAAALKAELFAMEKEGLTKIVSSPRIFTLDNQQAVVFQGEQIPYETSGDGGTSSVSFKDAGIQLTVTPSIVGDGNIVMDVRVTKDSANRANAIGSNVPIDKREVQTKLLIRDRSVAVIGGVFKQENSSSQEKVPGLADLPGIGRFFRRDTQSNARTELLIFLAPRVI